MTQIVDIRPHVKQELTYSMGADVLATQGARASAAMKFAMLNRTNSVPVR